MLLAVKRELNPIFKVGCTGEKMAFIDKIIGPDEKLIGIARLHWIYGAKGLLWLVALLMFGGFVKLQIATWLDGRLDPIGSAIFWGCTVMGVVLFLFYVIMMFFTELGLTTQRCIYKRGLLFVDVKETDLEEIKSANIDNGILGRILNYGYIKLDARFVKDVNFPAINDPYRFIKALNDARTSVKEDSLRMVLDEPTGRVERAKRRQGVAEQEREHHMEDHEYDAFSHNMTENVEEAGRDIQESVSHQRKEAGKQKRATEHRKTEKEAKSRHPEPQEAPDTGAGTAPIQGDNIAPFEHYKKKKSKLFVHEDALHDKVIDDFEEAENKEQDEENKVEN